MPNPEGGPRPEINEEQLQPKTEEQILEYIHDFVEENKDTLGYEDIYRKFEEQGYPRNMIVDSNIHYYLDENHEEFGYQRLYTELYDAQYTRDEIVDANITHYLKDNLGKYSMEELEKALLEVDPPYTKEEIDRNAQATVYKPVPTDVQTSSETAPAPVEPIEEALEPEGDKKPEKAATAPFITESPVIERASFKDKLKKLSIKQLETKRDSLQSEIQTIDDFSIRDGEDEETFAVSPELEMKRESLFNHLNKVVLEIERRIENEENKKKFPANFKFKRYNPEVPLEDSSVEYLEKTLLPLFKKELEEISADTKDGVKHSSSRQQDVKSDLSLLKIYLNARKAFEAKL